MEEKDKIIEYKGVEVLRKEHIVLKNVNFSISSGQLVYLIGKVGAGKSSLMKTFYAEVPVKEGDARVLDYDVKNIRQKDIPFLRRQIGIVFQDFRLLFDRNVFSNLDFVLRATGWKNKTDRDIHIMEVLKKVGMENKSYKMPFELSGGEQQRVVIARALLNSPRLILADEPTGNLDPETGEKIIARLAEIAEGGTSVIVATHNHSLIDKFPGRIFECENKSLIEIR